MEYIKAIGIWYANELPTIKKKKDTVLQPIYEAFTNSWEAIIEKYTIDHLKNGKITIRFYVRSNAFSHENGIYDFEKITVGDNGIGLNQESYNRLINLRDNRKNFSNKGTGRIQYLHFFDDTIFESVYKESEHITKKRQVALSKKDAFLKENAILRLDEDIPVEDVDSFTTVIFKTPLDEKDCEVYKTITSEEIKKDIQDHFLSRFCDNRNNLPTITICRYIDAAETACIKIESADIPTPGKEDAVTVHYSKLSDSGKVVYSDAAEDFTLRSFVQSNNAIERNAIYLVSKGEIACNMHLDNLLDKETIDGNRYMFLLSGDYIDKNDGDDRGNIELISAIQFRKQEEGALFPDEVVLLDDIEEETNRKIGQLYKEIGEKNAEKQKNIEELQRSLNSLGEKRLSKRPDILLFPEEGKCLIIEFKAPDVNASEHLTQIDFYASLLRNYTIDELQITSFYGYLIGESIEDRDVRGRVSRFEYSPRFNYWFRPSEKVIDFNKGNDGNLYTEIMKYSSLLERAKLRNKIFIDKLGKGDIQ